VEDGYILPDRGALAEKKSRTVSQVALGRLLEAGEFKFLFVYNMNPALTLPDQEAVRRGLLREDLYVVLHDTHWTETAKYVDVVLPAPTYLEKEDIVIPYSHPYVRRSRKAIAPLCESRDEVWVMRELAKRLGLEEGWVFEDPWEAVEKALGDAFEGGHPMDLTPSALLRLRSKPSEEYQTSTGRIEFYSRKAEEMGLNPLPIQLPPTAGQGRVHPPKQRPSPVYPHAVSRGLWTHSSASLAEHRGCCELGHRRGRRGRVLQRV